MNPAQKIIRIIRIQSRICIGGPAIHTEILSQHFPKSYQTILIGGAIEPGESCKYDELKEKGIDVRIIHCMNRELSFWNDLKSFWQLYKIIRAEKPDIVHTHTAKAGAVGRLAAFVARVPVIVHTFHGHTFRHYFGKTKTSLFIAIEKLLGLITDKIITISPRQRRDIAEIYKIAPPHKITVIPNGFELDKFFFNHRNGMLKRALNLKKSACLLGIVGRIVPIKNHIMALDVLKLLLDESDHFHLAIVGDGEDRPRIEAYAKALGIDKHVHFLGWVTDIESIYEGLGAVILTSWSEGTPVALIEAAASRVPVISTNVGGILDILPPSYHKFTCEPDDCYQMVKNIKSLFFENALSQQIIEEAFQSVKVNFIYRRLISDVDKLYRVLLIKKHVIRRVNADA